MECTGEGGWAREHAGSRGEGRRARAGEGLEKQNPAEPARAVHALPAPAGGPGEDPPPSEPRRNPSIPALGSPRRAPARARGVQRARIGGRTHRASEEASEGGLARGEEGPRGRDALDEAAQDAEHVRGALVQVKRARLEVEEVFAEVGIRSSNRVLVRGPLAVLEGLGHAVRVQQHGEGRVLQEHGPHPVPDALGPQDLADRTDTHRRRRRQSAGRHTPPRPRRFSEVEEGGGRGGFAEDLEEGAWRVGRTVSFESWRRAASARGPP